MAYANITDFVVRQLRDAMPGADAAQEARHLVSVIEGLRWPVLFGVYTEQQAMDILDTQLDLIFRPTAKGNRGPPARQPGRHCELRLARRRISPPRLGGTPRIYR